MEADRVEGLLYEDLSWDTPLFDNASEKCDKEYVQNAVELASNNNGCWDALQMKYQRRQSQCSGVGLASIGMGHTQCMVSG